MDHTTWVIVNATTCEVVTACRDEEQAEVLGDQVSDFDPYSKFYIQEVTLH